MLVEIEEQVAKKLFELAEQRQQSVNDVVKDLLKKYGPPPLSEGFPSKYNNLEKMAGIFDEDISDLSSGRKAAIEPDEIDSQIDNH